MKVKVIVEMTAEEITEMKSGFYADWDIENILFERISENDDYYLQDIEVKVVE